MASKFETTHKSIMNHALALISELGYENVTVELICKATEIGRSTFYNHFKGIEELVEEHFKMVETISPEQLSWILAAPTTYEKALRVQINFIQESKEPERITLYNLNLRSFLVKASPQNLDRSHDMKSILLPLIRQAQDGGEIRNMLPAEQLCDAAITIHWGNLFMWGISNGSFERVESIRSALEALYQPREDLLGIRL